MWIGFFVRWIRLRTDGARSTRAHPVDNRARAYSHSAQAVQERLSVLDVVGDTSRFPAADSLFFQPATAGLILRASTRSKFGDFFLGTKQRNRT